MGGYQLLGLIARGGMGAVYEALEVQLERKVALKVIAPPNPDDHDSEELVQRFMQEARTLARINHPNVITIYTIDTAEAVPFITMELVEGISFKELLHVSFLSADLAVPMFIQMLDGLQCLHANRIVHRDLKPHNVMVRKDGQIKILDFGIAKPVDSGNFTHVGVVVGSLAYMAPEVKLGIAATERSDLWNLGAIFYECLTGKALPKVLADNPNAKDIPYAANSPIPLEIRAIIAKLCHHRPLERYENCEQAIEDLKSFQRKRSAVTPDVMQAFTRKVEEILAKRKGDSKDLPAAEIMPVLAAALPENPSSISTYRREHAYTPRERRKPEWNVRYVGAGVFAVLVVFGLLLKPKFAAQSAQPPVIATPVAAVTPVPPPVSFPAVVPKTEDKKPLKFNPPPVAALNTPPELVSPANDEIVTLDPNEYLTMTWSRELKTGEFEIQIASDRAFRKTLVKESVVGESYQPGRALPEGKYYWRLTPKNADSGPVGPSRFTVNHATPLELETPSESANIEFSAKEKGATVNFTWKCKRSADAYQIQLAVGPKFASGGRDNGTSDCAWRESSLPPATYRWRVRPMNRGKVAGNWSDSRDFTVTKKTPVAVPVRTSPVALARPVLGEFTNQFTLKFQSAPRDLASVAKAISAYPNFKWQPVKNAKKYLVQISAKSDFTKVISQETLSGTSFDWKEVVPGVFFWRVAAVSDKQEKFSEPGQFTVWLPAPKIKNKYKFEGGLEGDTHALSWAPVPLAEKYLVQFGPKRQLAEADQHILDGSKFTLPSKPGQYFVRVAAANDRGEAASQFSNVSPVSVEAVPLLDSPVLKLPKLGATAVVRSGRLSITFLWDKVAKADSYVLELASDEEFTQIIDRINAKEPTHVVKKLEVSGKVFWRVRADGKEGSSAWSETSHFEVRK